MVIHDVDYFPEGHKWGRVVRHIAKNVPGLYNFDDQFAKWQLYYPPTPWESPTGPPTLVGSMNPQRRPIPCHSHRSHLFRRKQMIYGFIF